MGHAQVWLAIKAGDKPSNTFPEELGLRRTGQFEEFVTAKYVLAASRSGWSILIANRAGDRLVRDDRLATLSANCELVAGEAEEHVMVSWLSGWKNGQKVWSVLHNPEMGLEHLDVSGNPPAPFPEIYTRLLQEARQAGSDEVDHIFDVPTTLSLALIGYKHDDGLDSDNPAPYEILESTEVARPLWKKVLGLR
jgi:hypothetical protein